MLENDQRRELDAVLRYGGGLNTRASEEEIKDSECAEGENFDLDLDNSHFRNRKPFDKIATVPNGAQINGFIQLRKRTGQIFTAVHAGDTVYEWNGTTSFANIATVSASSRLYGTLDANWTLDDKVLIADRAKVEVLKEWDGTTFQDVTTNLGADFICKYAFTEKERAWYANVESPAGTDTPHLIAGSKREDYTDLDLATRAPDAVGAADPFFILSPDLRPINALIPGFGLVLISTEFGNLYSIIGEQTTDFFINSFYELSFASGDDGVVHVGNDIFISRDGAIDTLSGVDTFKDIENDDLTRLIKPTVEDVKSWRMVYNERTQRIYCFPNTGNVLYVMHKPIYDEFVRNAATRRTQTVSELSPWMKWTTQHSSKFNQTAVMSMFDPISTKKEIYWGDANGNIYMLEGSGSGDAGQEDIVCTRTSKVVRSPTDDIWDNNGYVYYRKPDANFTMKLEHIYGGDAAYTESTTIEIEAANGVSHFGSGSGAFYGGGAFFGKKRKGRLVRREWSQAGRASQFQIRQTITGKTDFEIAETGFRFKG